MMATLPANSPLLPLVQEHAAGLRQLAALDKAATVLGGKGPSPEILAALADFQGFLDKDLPGHFRREEEHLFPYLEAALGADRSPTAVLRKEHADLMALAQVWRQRLEEIEAASPAMALELQRLSRRIIAALGQHFRKEDEVLFPLCHKALSPETLAAIGEKVRHGDVATSANPGY